MNSDLQLQLFHNGRKAKRGQNGARGVLSPQHIHQLPAEHTPGHLHCQACLEARSLFAAPISASMSFSQAADVFLESRRAPVSRGRVQYISPRTLRDYEYYLKTLNVFFGQLPLNEIHLGHFAEYERRRAAGEGFTRVIGNRKGGERVPSPAGSNKIRSEIALAQRILRRAGLWSEEMKENYLPLQQTDSDVPRALSPDEQDRFLAIAGTSERWEVIWWYSMVALHLTFSSDEMRTIRIGDINLHSQIISVNRRYGKNKYRRRVIPICDAGCSWALERLIERAKNLAGAEPHHFLFPFRVAKGTWDPEKPMGETGLRKAFEEVRAAAHVPWFRLNGWRHTAITRLAEAGVPIAMIMQRSGHVTARMSEHYTHISEQAHRATITAAGANLRRPVMSIDQTRLRQQMVG